MSDYDEDPIDEVYATDPDGTTRALIAQAAAVAAQEIAAMKIDHHEADYQRMYGGQVESATLAATQSLKDRYGAQEIERLAPRIGELIEAHPALVPAEVHTSPTALEQSLDAVVALAKQQQAEADDADAWNRIKANNSNIPRVWLG